MTAPVIDAPAPATAPDPTAPPAPVVPVVPPAPVVPETYDLKVPDGTDASVVERTVALARELGLDNAAAQKLADREVETHTANRTATEEAQKTFLKAYEPGGTEWVKQDAAWRAEALADPVIGGSPEKLATSVELAQQALNKYGTNDLREQLKVTGFGSNPAVIKFLAKIGKAAAESPPVIGLNGKSGEKIPTAVLLYGEDGMGPKPKTS